jgi:aspartyl/asparaginyl-tRNA synthetase
MKKQIPMKQIHYALGPPFSAELSEMRRIKSELWLIRQEIALADCVIIKETIIISFCALLADCMKNPDMIPLSS